MPKQITLDGLELKGISIFREGEKVRVEAHYSLLSGKDAYRTETREVAASLPAAFVTALKSNWDTLLARIKELESI